ncbi:hypothetical protein AtubIFM55763_002492 [Aspergillus tubingensis]|uniref:DUF952 domain protein n=4 Tax=Aspergillus subgen. Circumdati TaxID=2720871 RepID=A0A317W1S8_ASPEC|nr:uncharacterized protein BO83DRAFT_355182 [Aspergillus eucalypticola CBS 122712]XP_025543125.1 hypothetical protein BO79DRAFT_189042 [Aspergillus costaricaensis CBS 115574]XP_035358482.1 peptidyl-prolyl cis-trans isomerase [Aspergillus tubingensis]GAQ38991.1 similar to An07g08200 [Aspergillus niger]PWY79945.1 hypothetical protein BO83DRAFT_355182 [Aspergillus eucalypticola CBS 122712]RAK92290.1 hypothetical protein BO79DRAFT_189042 [Aspergillus costaricaensis CBS 115574]GFN17678.1 peptidyl-
MADAEPLYVYKLIPSTSPVREPLPDRLPVSELDEKSGFVHLSTAFQVPNTLKMFFKDEPLVYVLRIPFEGIAGQVRWENPDGTVCGPRPKEGLFPHLYNDLKLGKDEVETVAIWKNDEGWDKALLQAKPWLLY